MRRYRVDFYEDSIIGSVVCWGSYRWDAWVNARATEEYKMARELVKGIMYWDATVIEEGSDVEVVTPGQ